MLHASALCHLPQRLPWTPTTKQSFLCPVSPLPQQNRGPRTENLANRESGWSPQAEASWGRAGLSLNCRVSLTRGRNSWHTNITVPSGPQTQLWLHCCSLQLVSDSTQDPASALDRWKFKVSPLNDVHLQFQVRTLLPRRCLPGSRVFPNQRQLLDFMKCFSLLS